MHGYSIYTGVYMDLAICAYLESRFDFYQMKVFANTKIYMCTYGNFFMDKILLRNYRLVLYTCGCYMWWYMGIDLNTDIAIWLHCSRPFASPECVSVRWLESCRYLASIFKLWGLFQLWDVDKTYFYISTRTSFQIGIKLLERSCRKR